MATNDGTDEDAWGSVLFEASFGGLPLYVLNTTDVFGNRLVRHVFPHRDGQELEPMGSIAKASHCKIFFMYPKQQPGNFLDPTAYFRAFMAIVDSPDAQRFTHPLFGSFMARVGPVNVIADAEKRDRIEAECTFEEDTLNPAVFQAATAFATQATMTDVNASQAELEDAVAEMPAAPPGGYSGTQAQYEAQLAALQTAGSSAVTRATNWSDPAYKLRNANLELAQSIAEIDIAQQNLGASLDVGFYPIITACNDLKLSLIQRWKSTQQATQIIQVVINQPSPLALIAAQIYGAQNSEARFQQIMSLNDIRNPLRIDAGTTLSVQSPQVPVTGAPTNGNSVIVTSKAN